MPSGYTYILGSHTGTLYIGVTSDLFTRIVQHRNGTFEGFSKTYGCTRLLYYEEYGDIRIAIAREKQLKGWRREKKLNLIRKTNPTFKNLAELWGSQMLGPDESIAKYEARKLNQPKRTEPPS
jgi:putative endonuclease